MNSNPNWGAAGICYLDNAATSFPKPNAVAEAVMYYLTENGAPYGRSGSSRSLEVSRRVSNCRALACRVLGVSQPNRMIFTLNGSDSLRLAMEAGIAQGEHIICTDWDHNSVLRPLFEWERQGRNDVSRLKGRPDGSVCLNEFRQSIRPSTRWLIMPHASNVTGRILPVHEMAEIAAKNGVHVILDAAQTAGHVPLNWSDIPVAMIATSGHKGLLGPLGTGLLWISDKCKIELANVRCGGTGSQSDDLSMPTELPFRYEPGNLNVPGILGLEQALQHVWNCNVKDGRQRELGLTSRLIEGLCSFPQIRIYRDYPIEEGVGIVSITVDGWEPQMFASLLDEQFNIQVRAGLQCAPMAHQALGTTSLGGTIRFSIGAWTTEEMIDRGISAVSEILSS